MQQHNFLNLDYLVTGKRLRKKIVVKGHNFSFWLANFKLEAYFIDLNKKVNIWFN